ncbi:MAG: hypothetical protein LBV16_01575, partial [Elusimicrobiota bacterium]|nr:hypothetical protein [Elusimicrobiota bacterium]
MKKIKQILKTISKYISICVSVSKPASVHVSVGADPRVCPSQINLPLNRKFVVTGFGFAIACVSHVCVVIAGKTRNLRRFLFSSFPNVSPTPSLPSVPIGNPFSPRSASLFFNRLCRLFSLPLFSSLKSKLSFKFLLTAFIVVFLSLSAFAARQSYTSGTNTFPVPAGGLISGNGGGNGGAIYISGAATQVNINFTGNVDFYRNGDGSTASGGAIYMSGGKLYFNITGTLYFRENTAQGGAGNGAGAIYFTGDTDVTMTAANIIIYKNQGGTDGGSFAFNGGGTRYLQIPNTVNRIQISSNTSAFGGAIYGNGGTNYLTFMAKIVEFLYNTASNNPYREGAGGVIQFNGAVGNIDFFGVSDANRITVNYIGNTANYGNSHGGVLALYTDTNLHYNYTNLVFNNNLSIVDGGVIWAQSNALVEFKNFSFRADNNKAQYGGIIALAGNARVTFENGSIEFTSNTSWNNASVGNISLGASNVMTLTNISSLIGRYNKAGQAGLLYLPNISFNFTGTTMELTGNTAFNGRGGGFYFTNSTTVFSGQNMTFKTNMALTAIGHGGAIYIEYSNATFGAPLSMIFDGNSAGGSGGGMYFLNSRAYFTQSNSMQFLNNIAATNGGAMYFGNSYASFA